MKKFKITKVDESMRDVIQQKVDNLNKPKGSLGRLESLAMQICLIQQRTSPTLHDPFHLLFGGDHGIEREHVSVSPREITWQQMINFTHGGGGINMFCRQHGFKLRIVDMGVDYDLSSYPDIINHKIAPGTKDFLYEAAMSQDEFDKAIKVGAQLAYDCYNDGSDIISLGEMGIANTSPSSIWMSIFGHTPLQECVGAGAGLNEEGIHHKYEILKQSVDNFYQHYPNADARTVIRYFGGFEMIGAIGAMLKAAELHLIILVDGFIMTACMLAASQIYPEILDYAIFAHCGDECGHRKMLDMMHAEPLLNLGLRLGEGTGAICAYPIVDSAVRMINEMNNFQNANITKYF